MNISHYTNTCAAALIVGHTPEGQPLAQLANHLFDSADQGHNTPSMLEKKTFILDPKLKAYIDRDQSCVPCVADDPESRRMPDLKANTIVIGLGFEPVGEKNPSPIPHAHCIASIGPYSVLAFITKSPGLPPHIRAIREAELPVIIPPMEDGTPDIATARAKMEALFNDENAGKSHTAMLFPTFEEKMQNDEGFSYCLKARNENYKPNEAIIYIWKDAETSEIQTSVLSHSGSYFFYACDLEADPASCNILNMPEETGLWLMKNGVRTSSTVTAPEDEGIIGTWTKLPISDETAHMMGHRTGADLEIELLEIERNI